MKTVTLQNVAVETGKGKVAIQSVVAKSWFLTDRQIAKIGEKKVCNRCGNTFLIGEAELYKYSHDKGKLKKKVMVNTVSEEFIDVNLTKNPIDLSQYQMSEQAIIFGVEFLNMHSCAACTAITSAITLPSAQRSSGGGERSSYGSGESESN